MTEWILAYDAGCGMCADVSDRVRAAAGSRLTLAGLDEPRVGAPAAGALRRGGVGPDVARRRG